MEIETKAILHGLDYRSRAGMCYIVVEIDSRVLQKIILKEWKIPWYIREDIDQILQITATRNIVITHTFREANLFANKLANLAI